MPNPRAMCRSARAMPAIDCSNPCSCRAMLRIRALLSLLTSVAVLTYPVESKSK